MALTDFTETSSSITAITAQSEYAQILEKTVERIHALNLFRIVTTAMREQPRIDCPACIAVPGGIEVIERQLSGAKFDLRFTVDIDYVLKHPNDCLAIQYAMGLTAQIFDKFSKADGGNGPPLFTITGAKHYDTRVQSVAMETVAEFDNNVLALSSGLQIVYSLWKTVT